MRSDGNNFESMELDNAFRFLKEVTYEKKSIDEAFYPKRLTNPLEIAKWKKVNYGTDQNMRLVHIKDPNSFYNRFG